VAQVLRPRTSVLFPMPSHRLLGSGSTGCSAIVEILAIDLK
jgi:hypothetical protein